MQCWRTSGHRTWRSAASISSSWSSHWIPTGNKYYPPDNLFKIVWAGLEDGAPAAWEFLHNFNYSTADQVSMLGAIDNDGKSVEEAAADWIAANEATWSAWIPS